MTTTQTAPLTTASPDDLRVEGDSDSRKYRYPPTGELFISMSTVTSSTKSRPYLAPWGSNVAAITAGRRLRELLALAEATEAQVLADLTGEAGALLTAGQIAEQARAAGERAVILDISKEATRIRNLKREVGSYVHKVVESLILWAASPGTTGSSIALPELPVELRGAMYDDDPVEDVAEWMTEGFINWVTDFDPVFLAAEMVVYNPELKAAGTLDTIIALLGRAMDPHGQLIAAPGQTWTSCVDVKTGKHTDETMPEQCTGYRRCPLCLVGLDEIRMMPPTDGSGVVHLRPEYPKGYRFMPISRRDDALAWNRFRGALRLAADRDAAPKKPGQPAYPLLPDGTVPPRLLADLDSEGYGRAPGALDKAGVRDLGALADLDEAGCLALRGVGPKTIPVIRQLLADHGLHLAGDEPADNNVPAEPTGKVA
jgi:hypothetical protein